MTAPLLNIAALSRRTGIAPDTLRKWELRYGVLRPERTPGGQRRYSELDVQRVEWLRDRIRDGWRIGEAARVIDEASAAALDEPTELRDALIASIRDSDPVTLSATLDQAFAVLPLEQALTDVVTPALRWTGEAWHRGELSVAQEHAISAKVRAHLGRLISDGQGGVHGVAVLAGAPGERHDIGLLMLAVMLRTDGWRVEFLGADTPVASAITFADDVGATMLCLSASRAESLESLRSALAAVSPPDGLALVLGGPAVTPEIARDLRATYADGKLDLAVARLRKLAIG
jgi:DNA-binding transcriptional MerR regulator/methylmalonyl-CoA mutase cobalamin-binding subunit